MGWGDWGRGEWGLPEVAKINEVSCMKNFVVNVNFVTVVICMKYFLF